MIIFNTWEEVKQCKNDIFYIDYNPTAKYCMIEMNGDFHWKRMNRTAVESIIQLRNEYCLVRCDKKQHVKEQKRQWDLEPNKIFL